MINFNSGLTFGRLIAHLREQRGLTQTEVAEQVGIRTPGYIGLIEGGKRTPSPMLTLRLADVLGCPRRQLIAVIMRTHEPEYFDELFGGKIPQTSVSKAKSISQEGLGLLERYEKLRKEDKETIMRLTERLMRN